MLLSFLLASAAIFVLIRGRHFTPPSSQIPQSWSENRDAIAHSLIVNNPSHVQTERSISETPPSRNTVPESKSMKWVDFPSSAFSFMNSAPNSNTGTSLASKAPSQQSSTDIMKSGVEAHNDSSPAVATENGVASGKTTHDDTNPVELICASYVSFRSVLEMTYDSHVTLIRHGIPSRTVKHFYDDALRYLARSECSCSGERSRISNICEQAVFFRYSVEVVICSRLFDLIEIDNHKSGHDQKFPLYHKNAQNPLPELSSEEKAAIRSAKMRTFEMLLLAEGEEKNEIMIDSVFPDSEELLFVEGEQNLVCDMFRNVSVGLPVGHYMAYSIGLATHILLSDANDEEGTILLNEATSNAFILSLCRKRDRNTALIPFHLFEDQMEHVKGILRGAVYGTNVDSPEQQWINIPTASSFSLIINVAYYLFKEDIDFLSSIDSHGRPIVMQNVGKSVYLRRISKQITEEVSVFLLGRAYASARAVLKGTDANGGSQNSAYPGAGTGMNCPSGWKYVPRVGPVANIIENCCSVKCEVMENVIYSYIVQSEVCCRACNLLSCEAGVGTTPLTGTSAAVPSNDISAEQPAYKSPFHGVTMVSI